MKYDIIDLVVTAAGAVDELDIEQLQMLHDNAADMTECSEHELVAYKNMLKSMMILVTNMV